MLTIQQTTECGQPSYLVSVDNEHPELYNEDQLCELLMGARVDQIKWV